MKLRAQRLADWRRDRRQFLRELGERVAEAIAEARARKERAHTLGGAVEAIRQDALDPIGRLVLKRGTLELLIGLGKGYCTGVLGVAQMPDHPATDHRRQIHLVSET